MWIERLMAGISHQHVLSYNPRNVMAWLAFALVKVGLKKQRSPETLQQTGFPDFVEGAELLFCQTSNILADAVHLTVQQLRVFCGFQVR